MNDPEDNRLVEALLHHVNVLLSTDGPENANRERDLADVRKSTALAESIISGRASQGERSAAIDQLHPSVRSSYDL